MREIREYLTPISHTSSFKTTGKITPEEFITAGDHLVYKFPTWNWGSAVTAANKRDFLPKDKQYLVTEQVPSYVRAIDFETLGEEAAEASASAASGNDIDIDEDGDWVGAGTGTSSKVTHKQTAQISSDSSSQPRTQSQKASIPDMDDNLIDLGDSSDAIQDIQDDDDDVFTGNTRLPTRTYNIYITYSTSYRVPKVYLSGFNENGAPLLPNEMMEDVMSDYRDKTVTIEKAPWDSNLTLISIHPCRHANVMRVLLDRAEARMTRREEVDQEEEQQQQTDISPQIAKLGLNDDSVADEWEEIEGSESHGAEEAQGLGSSNSIPVDQYLVIFLKFIASVTPGIEHDYTMSAF